MPSLVRHVAAADGTDLLVRALAGRRGRGRRRVGRPAVGLGPARPRPRRALRPLRARRRPARGRRHRVDRLRPARQWAGRAAGAGTSTIGRSSTTTSPNAWPPSGAAPAGGPVVLYGHSLGGLVVAGYLLTDRPKPDLAVLDVTGARLDPAGLEEGRWRRSSRASRRPRALPNDIDASTLSREPRSRRRPWRTRLRQAVHDRALRGRGDARAGARPRARHRPGSAFRRSSCTAIDDGLVPATASDVLEGAAGRGAPDLSRPPPRAPQRARRRRRSSTK